MSAFALTGLKVVNFGLDLSGSVPAARLASKGPPYSISSRPRVIPNHVCR